MPTSPAASPSVANSVSLPGSLTPLPSGTPWQIVLLSLIGAPQTSNNYSFLNGWFAREHSHSDVVNGTVYGNNPFFSTAGGAGSADKFHPGMYPTAPGTPGVALYPSLGVGVVATAANLTQYPHIMAALQSGNPQGYAQGQNGGNFSSELRKWSGSGYGGFPNGSPNPTGPAIGMEIPQGILSAGDKGISLNNVENSGVGQAVSSTVQAAKTTGQFLSDLSNPMMWLRIAEVVGGAILIGLALYLIAKEMGINVPKPPGPLGGAADDADELAAAFQQGQRQGQVAAARRAGRAQSGAVVTGSETAQSQRFSRVRSQADSIPSDDIPF